jgi:hypothetical protein
LDFHGALNRIDHTCELGQHAVAGRVNEFPVMLLDETVDYSAMHRQGLNGRLFVVPHEATVAMDVGTQYGGEPTFHPTAPVGSLSAKDRRLSTRYSDYAAPVSNASMAE